MNYACAVCDVQSVHHGQQDAAGLLETEPAHAVEPARQGLALEKLHDHVEGVAVLADVIHLDDVRVVDATGDLGLAHETANGVGVSGQCGQQPLNGEALAGQPVADLEYCAHSALAKHTFDGVLASNEIAFLRELIHDRPPEP